MAILADETSAQFTTALEAGEAAAVPRLAQGGQDGVFYGVVALRAIFPFHAFIVVRFPFKNQILSGDSAVALSARHQLSCAIGTMELSVVFIVRAQ